MNTQASESILTWQYLELQHRIKMIQARALERERSRLIDELLERIRDGADLLREGKTTAAEAFRMARLQCERIDAFDRAVKDRS